MEEFSNTTVWELLKIMQRKVKGNANIIKKNVNTVELIKKKYGPSLKRDKIINSIYKNNYDLTKENTSLLELHNALFKFYREFKKLLSNPADSQDSDKSLEVNWKEYRESCMKKSISGDIKINSYHPFVGDGDFFAELMDRCSNMELYERCSEIKKVKEISNMRS